MPNLQNNDVLLYTVRYSQAGQTFLNTWLYRYVDDISGPDDYVTFANQFMSEKEGAANLIESLADIIHSSCVIEDHRMQLIYPNRLVAVVRSLAVPGTYAGTALPTNTAATVTKRSINATRWGIGSWHQPGLTSSALTNAGALSNTYKTALESAISAHLRSNPTPAGAAGEIDAVLWSKAVPLRFSVLTSVTTQDTPRVMRRRTVGVGK